jgi:hypothetical protein
MVEQYEHLADYHAVFAQSLGSIVNLIAQKQDKDALQLIRYNIIYSYTLWRTIEKPDISPSDVSAEISGLNLDNKNRDELLVMMVTYQSRAGLRPVQRYVSRARTYGRVRGSL